MADLLTTREIQETLQVDRTTIYRMVESGQLPAIRVGKQWRFARADLERWLRTRSAPGAAAAAAQPAAAAAPGAPGGAPKPAASLVELLPLAGIQLIQDAFAELLGVMLLVTDMEGRPATRPSNPCGLYDAVMGSGEAVARCIQNWQRMAGALTFEPKFAPSDLGLLCARGLIRLGNELTGMVFLGGIAPENWPPDATETATIAAHFGVAPECIQANLEAVYRLDRPARDRALGFVQRFADSISYMLEDRNTLVTRLQTIASLTLL